jgi:hypothetical protein
MGSGKSTIANLIAERAKMEGHTATVLPFAKPLKDYAKLLGWDGKKDAKGRRLLQLLGTECGRKCISEDLWVSKWKKALVDLELDNEVIICDDLRFRNEYEAAKSFGIVGSVVTVKLKGRGIQVSNIFMRAIWHIRRMLGLLHASEMPIPDYMFDIVFDNSGSHYQLDGLIEQIFYRTRK